MSDRVRLKSGNTSTFIPGGTGNAGSRSPVTFFTDKDQDDVQAQSFFASIDSSVYKICHNLQNIEPAENDYIIYAMNNITYLAYITGHYEANSEIIYNTEVLDSWDTQMQQGTDSTSINLDYISLSVSCISNNELTHRRTCKKIMIDTDPSIPERSYHKGVFNDSDIDLSSTSSGDYFRFTVASTNNRSLGDYKIQLEFVTKNISPRMDTKIADKFTLPESYTSLPSRVGLNRTFENATFKGYLTNYSSKGITDIKHSYETNEGTSYNFDDERLDNFNITIKDYNDGVGDMLFYNDVCLPTAMMKRVATYDPSAKYKCNMYIYIKNQNNTYNKVWMGDFSDILNSLYN